MANNLDPNTISYMKQVIAENNGLQRTNRFAVEFFNTPVALPSTPIVCDRVIFPQKAVNAVADALSGFGAGRIVPKAIQFNNGVGLVYPTYNNWAVEDFFERWQKFIYGQNTDGNFITEYYTTAVKQTYMKVTMFNTNGGITKVVKFTEVYPIEVQPNSYYSMQTGDKPVGSYFYIMNFREQIIEPTK